MTWQTMNLEQRIFLIKAVYRHGISAREIAAAIGASKGSIVGLYSRHKGALADFPLGTAQYVREASKSHPKPKSPPKPRIVKLNKPRHPEPLRVGLVENRGCMWPVNDGGPYLFCGHVKFKGSYCKHHHVRSMGSGTEGERRALSVLRAKG